MRKIRSDCAPMRAGAAHPVPGAVPVGHGVSGAGLGGGKGGNLTPYLRLDVRARVANLDTRLRHRYTNCKTLFVSMEVVWRR